jgi:hypothetical protein
VLFAALHESGTVEVFGRRWGDEALERGLVGEPGMGVEELQLAGVMRMHEHRQHLALEQARQHVDMHEEVGTLTGVIRDQRMPARGVLAACDVAAERRRATALDRIHHLQLLKAHMGAVGLTPTGP